MNEKLKRQVEIAQAHLALAEKIADELGESFRWEAAYGMGGFYRPKGTTNHCFDKYDIRVQLGENDELLQGAWKASSESC